MKNFVRMCGLLAFLGGCDGLINQRDSNAATPVVVDTPVAVAADEPELCAPGWAGEIDTAVSSSDGAGHGPDIGSGEWQSVIEFRLGVRGDPAVPERGSQAWCQFIDERVKQLRLSQQSSPSFNCSPAAGKPLNSIEALICGDEQLSALDRSLSDVYQAALSRAQNEHPPVLRAQQRGWVKGRDECWKADAMKDCVGNSYRRRIAELQARYQLVPLRGPVRFFCNNNPANELIITFYTTTPPTLIAERGDSVSLMYQVPSASGSFYQGRNETFREKNGSAMLSWGYEAPVEQCQRSH